MTHSPASPAKPKGDILIVDDMPDNLRLLSAMLQAHGYEVRKSINGPLAIKAAQLAPPDLILLDINMPEMNGYQVCKKLVADRRTCDIPVIFISALGEALDKVRAFEAGGVDYITKPFQLPEVLARIENQLTIRQLQKQLLHQAQQLQEKNRLLEAEVEERQRAEAALRKANLELQRLATMDGLTGVANRRQFDDYLYQEWRRSQRDSTYLSLVLCDVDFFKAYNDAYGHQAGDDCLRRLARALERSVWRPADLVARYGGEEFAIVLPTTDARGCDRRAHSSEY